MAVINIPEAINTGVLRGSRQRRANAEATEAQVGAIRQNTRITKQSADYYDKTGTSEASQKDKQLDISAGRNAVDFATLAQKIKEHRDELSRTGTEDDRRRLEMLMSIGGAAYERLQKGGDPQKVLEESENLLKVAGISEDVAASGLDFSNRDFLGALAHAGKLINPADTVNFIPKGTKEIIGVDKNDMGEFNKKYRNPDGTYEGMFFGYGSAMEKPPFDPGNDPSLERERLADEATTRNIITTIDRMSELVNTTQDFTRGLPGAALRGVDSMVATVTSIAEEAGGKIKDGNTYVDDATWLEEKLGSYTGPGSEYKKLATQLAYMQARLEEGSEGRALSDMDRKIADIGLDIPSKAQVRSTLKTIRRQTIDRMKFKYLQRGQEIPEYMNSILKNNDISRAAELAKKFSDGTITEEELAEFDALEIN